MLAIVQDRFLRCAQRHLSEASLWFEVSNECRSKDDFYGISYANKKIEQHLQMVKFWHMAVNDVHYVPGTWAYRF